MRKRLFGYLLSCLFLIAGNVMAETVYVHDFLRLGVRNDPNSSETPIAVVTTGDALQVLERSGDYLKIRTPDGTEGWVSEGYVSKEKPARLQLEELRKAYSRNQEELKTLRKELTSTIEKSGASEKQLAEVNEEKTALQQKVDRFQRREEESTSKYTWVYQGGLLLIMFLLGFFFGMRRYKRRITDRLGGLEI